MSGLCFHRPLDALVLILFASLALVIPAIHAQETVYISGTDLDGATQQQLALDRTPSLYTGNFGDCLGGQSLLNVTKFDAALYYDNSTFLFHLDGTTNIRREDVILYISLNMYGESTFNMTVNPCSTDVNINSICPLNASQPITAFASFTVDRQQVSDIPQSAWEIPDLEGFARIQIFANSSETEIGCFQAVLKNGHTFSQVRAISPILGAFAAIAIVASFATAAYGVSVPHMRAHYAHSLSVLVVFETYHSIFYSGALSLNWPSVLPAWWSNFAWTAGLVPVPAVVRSVDPFVGVSGNASQVGGAGSTVLNNNGGLVQQIYGRSIVSLFSRSLQNRVPGLVRGAAHSLSKRQSYNPNDPYDYNWDGHPVKPGMPLPGDWTGFSGELSQLDIPAPDAFIIGLIWLLVIVGLVIVALTAFKFTLEGLVKTRLVNKHRLEFFRAHWMSYLSLAVQRTLLIAFFSIMTLSMYQFASRGAAGPTAIAAIVFLVFIVGIVGLALYAVQCRLHSGKFASDSDRILLSRGKLWGRIPCVVPVRASQLGEKELKAKPAASLPFIRWHFVDDDPSRTNVHQDESYIRRFGWLSARYRLSRWWFFAFWLAYQFVRACFLGAATGNPLAQVFGLFVVDILALVIIAALKPFEGQRNTAIAVWLLGLAKIVVTGLSIAFLPDFNLDRLGATVIGLVIIIVQALLTIALFILIILGAISTWLSLSRNREDFSPSRLEDVRVRYYEHIEKRATGTLPPLKPVSESTPPVESKRESMEQFPDLPRESRFSVHSVRRISKIGEEDEDDIAEINPVSHRTTSPMRRPGRTMSISSQRSISSLPRAARGHRASWSSRDFAQFPADMERASPALKRRLSGGPQGLRPSNAVGLVQGDASRSNLSFAPGISSLPSSRPMTPTKEVVTEEHEEDEIGLEEKAIESGQHEQSPEDKLMPLPQPESRPESRKENSDTGNKEDFEPSTGKAQDNTTTTRHHQLVDGEHSTV
ncbi:hypothetical protein F4775DRAFT_45343 [Biscogniauxia sp. FL1348]|nr:hypothetical protein F4775DRAFT_45343 [Biscogniauxia sp. FL1348]